MSRTGALFTNVSGFISFVSSNHQRAYRCDLRSFSRYVASHEDIGPQDTLDLFKIDAWRFVTHKHVESYVKSCLASGLAVNTINQRLSTIRSAAKLVTSAGKMNPNELDKIVGIKGLRQIDSVSITPEQVAKLRKQPNISQGRRDALLLDLFLEQGLCVLEIAELTVSSIDLGHGELCLPEKGNLCARRIKLTKRTLQSLTSYVCDDEFLPFGHLLQGSSAGGALTAGRMSARAIHKRVRVLGKKAGMEGITPEVLQAYWAAGRLIIPTPAQG